MQKETKLNTAFASLCLFLSVGLIGITQNAHADLKDQQSFRPIEWEGDFVSANSLSLTGMKLMKGAQIVALGDQELPSAYGLQLAQQLRDHWSGRVGLLLGRTGSGVGHYVWTFLGSDLLHPLIPEEFFEHSVFRYVRPNGFFGLGVVTRWENSGLGLNLIPTLRYESSEPVAEAGVQVNFPLSDEIIFEIEYRFLQSARVSRNRGSTYAASLIWGRIPRK